MTDKTPMTADEFRETMRLLGLTIERDADLLQVSKNSLYCYQSGTRPVPIHFAALLRVMLYQRQEPASVMALGYPQSDRRSLPR